MGVSALTCTSGSVTGAAADACTVSLSESAPSSGRVVTLSSNAAHVTVPSSVTVAAGASSASFTATVAAIYTPQTATLTATTNGVAQTYAISLIPPALRSLTCVTESFTGAGTDICTVALTAGAPWNGVSVNLLTNNGSFVTMPSSITLAPGVSSAAFTATVAAAYTAQSVTLTAKTNGVAVTYAISLIPPALQSLTCATGSFTGAGTDACTVTLTAGAPWKGVSVNLLTNNGGLVTVPSSITLAPGASSATFTASIAAAYTAQSVTLTAKNSGVVETYGINLVPPAPNSLACTAGSLTGAGFDACTVTLSAGAPSSGLRVSLSSNDTSLSVPAAVAVAAGSSVATFTATAAAVTTAQTATITASANGGSAGTALQLNPATPGLSLSSLALAFGTQPLNTAATQSVTLTSSGNVALTISSAAIVGSGFSVSGAGFPLTLNPNQTAVLIVSFDPTTAGSATGALTISSNATTGGTATVSLSGTGQAPPTPSAVSCTSNSLTGATTDACTVTLTAAAGSNSVVVSLSSGNSAVTVPASITVAGGATAASFTATAAAVTTAQTATITATANGGSAGTALQLNAYVSTLSVESTSVAFGDVTLNTPATQSLVLTASGTAPVTVSSGSLTGSGFSMSGVSFPLTLNANQSATLEVSFEPTAAGAASGSIALASNCSMGSMSVSLSGTGVAPVYSVGLNWQAPSAGSDPVESYNVYRAVSGSNAYTQIGSTTTTAYSDSSVTNGTTYVYYVESVDPTGNVSVPSNTYTAAIP